MWRRRISRGRRFSAPCEYVSGITLTVVSCLRLAPACPCDRMLHAQVCARQRLHTFSLVPRPKTAPRWQGLPLRAYAPRSGVCTSAPPHLYAPSVRSISHSSGIALARRLVACLSLSVKNETVLSLFPAAVRLGTDQGEASGARPCSLCTLRRGRPLGWCHSCVSPWLPSGSRARSCEMSATELPGFDPRRCRPGRGQALQLELLWAWVLSTFPLPRLGGGRRHDGRASVCSTLRCVHVKASTPLLS